ncbi:MAG: ABC transporter permease, partial [Clostridiales bacterium]|nr:ABC transporter permease [Clostridiales bacterium]
TKKSTFYHWYIASKTSIYINGSFTCNIPMIKGRFFCKDDYGKNEKLIVIGKGLRRKIMKIDGEDCYLFKNDYYKVIGIVGDEKKESSNDFKVFYNLDLNDSMRIEGNYVIDAGSNTENILEQIKKINNDVQINEILSKNEETVSELVNRSLSYTIKDKMQVILVVFLNIFIVTEFWIKSRKKEIAVRKMVGGSNLRIKYKVLMELILLSSSSFILGYVIYLVSTYFINGYCDFYFSSIIGILIFAIISATFAAVVPLRYITKMQPGQAIK